MFRRIKRSFILRQSDPAWMSAAIGVGIELKTLIPNVRRDLPSQIKSLASLSRAMYSASAAECA